MLNLKLGWLSPDGKLVECGSYEHMSVARDLVDKHKYVRPLLERKPDDDILIDNGWAHIGISALEHRYVIWWNQRRILSNEQKNFLFPYFADKDLVTSSCWINWEEDNDLR